MYFQTLRRVNFRDTDAAGIAHYSVFFHWMEQTEHEMFRGFNWSVVQKIGPQTVSWPRVNATCDYRSPLKFEQVFGVELDVVKLGNSSATFRFRFLAPSSVNLLCTTLPTDRNLGQPHDIGHIRNASWFDDTTRPIAEGTLTTVCCEIEHDLPPKPLKIPVEIRSHLESLLNEKS